MPRTPWPTAPKPAAALLLSMLCALALLLVGCGLDQAQVPEVPNNDPVLNEGRDIYTRNCASCHGAAGGGGRGLPLNEGRVLTRYPEIGDQLAVVAGGRNNMPAFGEKFTEDQIEAVVRYTREVLSAN